MNFYVRFGRLGVFINCENICDTIYKLAVKCCLFSLLIIISMIFAACILILYIKLNCYCPCELNGNSVFQEVVSSRSRFVGKSFCRKLFGRKVVLSGSRIFGKSFCPEVVLTGSRFVGKSFCLEVILSKSFWKSRSVGEPPAAYINSDIRYQTAKDNPVSITLMIIQTR